MLLVPRNSILFLNSDAIFLPSPINIVMHCIFFKNQIDILTVSFQSNLIFEKIYTFHIFFYLRFEKIYNFHIFFIYSQAFLLVKVPGSSPAATYVQRSGAQPEIFQGRGGFVELGHSDKLFVKSTQKKGPAGKNFGVFSPRYS